jgi:hypothetical protein
MRRLHNAMLAALLGLVLAGPARAGHHSWEITEIFSNGDGSVQFIEMFVANDGEAGVGPFTITSGANTFNFVTNLPSSSTANTWMLIATTSFASLPGAPTPDYVLPDGFLNTSGGTLNYASGADVWTHGTVPTDGINSLARDGSTGANSPTNFAGASGSVDASSQPLPSLPGWGLIVLVTAFLFAASGIFRRSSWQRSGRGAHT